MKKAEVLPDVPVSLADICPRRGCGLRMSTAILEHLTVKTCACGYEAKDQDGFSVLRFHEAIGGNYMTRSKR